MKNDNLKKYLPIEYRHNIFDIDFDKLKENGYKILFFDLDNTIADYETHEPDKETVHLFNEIKSKGFRPYILSNNHEKRIKRFEDGLGVKGYYELRKPFTGRIKKYIMNDSLDKSRILWIGDQAVTDVKCASELGIKALLLDPIKPSTEHWYTKFNRRVERMIFKKIKKNMNDIYLKLGLDKRYE